MTTPLGSSAPARARARAVAYAAVLTGFLLALWATLSWQALPKSPDGSLDPVVAPLLFQFAQLPRLAMGLGAGAALGLAGGLLQMVLRNPLASPTTLGAASGAQLALLLGTWLAPAWLPSGMMLAWLGAMGAMAWVLALSWRRGLEPTTVVLAGLVVNLYLGALASVLLMLRPEAFHGVLLWGAGTLYQQSWHDSARVWLCLSACAGLVWVFHTPLRLLTLLGDDAKHRGVPVTALRLSALALVSLLTACVISAVGMLGFVGLAAPAVVRLWQLPSLRQRLMACMGVGAGLLWASDLAVQAWSLWRGHDVPTGILTGLLGAPVLLILLLRTPVHSARTPSTPKVAPSHRLAESSQLRAWTLLLIAAVLVSGWALLGSPAGWMLPGQDPTWLWRWPRVLGAAVAGALLAWAGVLLQRVSGNPMAGPELMGVSAGTGLGVLAVMLIAPALYEQWALPAGLLGALAVMALLAVVNHRQGMPPERVLLTGMTLAALLDTAQRLALAGGDPRGQQILAWMSGSTYYTTAHGATVATLTLVGLGLLVVQLPRALQVLGLGTTMGVALGAAVVPLRWGVMVLAAGLTALATLLVGPLSFVGLLAPHLTRSLGLARVRDQLLAAPVLGALLMMLADALGRNLWQPYEIPAGVISTLIGGGFFLWLMRRL